MINIYFALALIIPKALYDGMRPKHPYVANVFEFCYFAAITIFVYAVACGQLQMEGCGGYFYHYIVGFLFFRFLVFDLVYNIAHENSLFFFGRTKWYDRFFNWLMEVHKVHISLIIFLKIGFGFWGIMWLLLK